MSEILHFLVQYGYLILFGVVFLEQVGLPVASVPVLLGVGAESAEGHFSFPAALAITLAACLPADAIWYEVGRRGGYKVLGFLCRISLKPDTCVERTTGSFRRHGMGTLAFAKFVPGLSAVATPMAGLMKMNRARFLALDSVGALLWGGVYLTLGVIFRRELERGAAIIARTGFSLVVALIGSIGAYFAWKWIGRRRYLRQLEMARISPDELWRRIQSGEELTILDLRSDTDDEMTIPGAKRLQPEKMDAWISEIPRDRDIVLFCT